MSKRDIQKELRFLSKLAQTEQQIALAALLSEHFEKKGVKLTVVGGAAVQFYTSAAYVTKDLDAILHGDTKEVVDEVMGGLGFRRTSSYRHFEYPELPFVVEFPPSPVEVGSRCISKFNEIKYKNRQVRVIRIEDIIMDRIIAGAEWKSKQSLAQAKLVYKKNKDRIDYKYLKAFAKAEGYEKELRDIGS